MDSDGTQYNPDAYNIPDVPIKPATDRVSPNQMASGVMRGSQFVVADATPRVLMGNQNTFGPGFYVSKSGIDATTNSDPANWLFNSNQNTLQVVETGTAHFDEVSANAGTTLFQNAIKPFTKTYTVLPIVLAFVTDGDTYELWGGGGIISDSASVSSTAGVGITFFQMEQRSQFIYVNQVVFARDMYTSGGNGLYGALDIIYYVLKQSVQDATT